MDSYPSFIKSSDSVVLPEQNVWIHLLVLFMLIALNAYFAASELAVVSLNDAKIEKMAQEGNKKAKLIYRMTSQPTAFLSTIQIGVTLSGFLSSAVAAESFAGYIVYWLRNLPIDLDLLRIISVVVITIILSFVTLVFGELLPKRVAMKDPEKIAFRVAGSLSAVNAVLKPLVFVVSKSVDLIGHLLGIREDDAHKEYSEEEIRILVDAGSEKGYIEEEEKEMINNIFDFNDLTVAEIMTHRIRMDALDINSSLDDTIELYKSSGHSRIPVYRDSIDDIVGILLIRDLTDLFLDEEKRKSFRIQQYMRDPFFVYENKKCDDLFNEMQKSKSQIAIVLDERGGTYGMVTMEDLLELIVGNIQDEFDNEEEDIVKIDENHYIVKGTAIIDDIAKIIGVKLDDKENYTIGGLIIDLLGHIPEENEPVSINVENATFTVTEIKDKAIQKIDIVIRKTRDQDETDV